MAGDRTISTVWRRADRIFTARPEQPETELGSGKNAKIVTTGKGDYVVFQQDGRAWAISPGQARPVAVGEGAYPKLTLLPNDRVLCLWEHDRECPGRLYLVNVTRRLPAQSVLLT